MIFFCACKAPSTLFSLFHRFSQLPSPRSENEGKRYASYRVGQTAVNKTFCLTYNIALSLEFVNTVFLKRYCFLKNTKVRHATASFRICGPKHKRALSLAQKALFLSKKQHTLLRTRSMQTQVLLRKRAYRSAKEAKQLPSS